MQVGKLVFHSEFGRGLIGKVSPSRSLIMVNFKTSDRVRSYPDR
jgi:hypothetical protein